MQVAMLTQPSIGESSAALDSSPELGEDLAVPLQEGINQNRWKTGSRRCALFGFVAEKVSWGAHIAFGLSPLASC